MSHVVAQPPTLQSVYFYLTQGCNLKCRHCWLTPPHQTADRRHPETSYEAFKKVVEQARPLGLTDVKLTGGEPFLNSNIARILKFIQTQDCSLQIETNGTLITKEHVGLLSSCKRVSVAVSLDGADAETHEWMRRVKGSFSEALRGIEYLASANIRTHLTMSLARANYRQIEKLAQLGKSLGATLVKANVVQPIARGKSMFKNEEQLSVEEMIGISRQWDRKQPDASRVRVVVDVPPAFRSLGVIYEEQCNRCTWHVVLGVLATELCAFCGIGENVPELVFGDVNRDSLEQVWNHSPVLNSLRNQLPDNLEGVCADCVSKRYCCGKCIAMNYYETRNVCAPFWFCQSAYEQGLFPESRLRRTFASKDAANAL